MEGDGGAGKGNVGKKASAERQQGEASGGWDSARGCDTLTQGVKVAVGSSEGKRGEFANEFGSQLGIPWMYPRDKARRKVEMEREPKER